MFIRKPAKRLWSIAAPLCLLVILLAALIFASSTLGSSTQGEGLKLAEQNLRRASVQCYALEGSYAPDLGYLETHYGVSVDESRYTVHYTYIAANLMPNITVLPVGEENPLDLTTPEG